MYRRPHKRRPEMSALFPKDRNCPATCRKKIAAASFLATRTYTALGSSCPRNSDVFVARCGELGCGRANQPDSQRHFFLCVSGSRALTGGSLIVPVILSFSRLHYFCINPTFTCVRLSLSLSPSLSPSHAHSS